MTQIYVQKLEKAGMGGIVSNISGDMKIVRSVNAKKTLKRLIGELHSMSVTGIAVSVSDCGKKKVEQGSKHPAFDTES